MALETQTLVIRIRRPWLRRLMWVAALVILPLLFYLIFEFGRMEGGYDRLFVWKKRRELLVQVEKLEKTNSQLRAQIAEFETSRVSQQQERLELARNVGDLQAQLARLNQDLTFYRGVVSSTVGAPPLKIQRVVTSAGDIPGRYRLRVVLVQASRPDNTVSGTMTLALRGTERGKPVTYKLESLTAEKREQLPFSFRYYQDIDQEVMLPQGFEPGSVEVEVRSGRPGQSQAQPLNQSFAWNVQAS